MFHRAESAARQQAREKFLRQFTGRVLLAPLAAQEAEDGLVIRLAQFAQRPARLDAFAPRAQDERPARELAR